MKYSKDIQVFANKIARSGSYLRATDIILGTQNRIISHINYGYRKRTTGQYVPNAYMRNFGWKNTYYQSAETVVEVNVNDVFDKLI
jgi:hypothetical protein